MKTTLNPSAISGSGRPPVARTGPAKRDPGLPGTDRSARPSGPAAPWRWNSVHFPGAALADSPAYRAGRRRIAELLADNHRLEFLRALDMSRAPLTDREAGFLQDLLERARLRRYHYAFSPRERETVDHLKHTHGDRL